MPHRAPRQHRIVPFLIPGLLGLLLAAGLSPASAAEFRIRPSIAISEEYSDNVNQDREKLSEFTTSINPGLELTCLTPRLDVSVRYGFEYLYYAQGNFRDGEDFVDHDIRHTLDARALATLVRNLFYLEAGNTFERVDSNLLRSESLADLPGDDPDTDAPAGQGTTTVRERDSSDRNIFFISPYFEFQPMVRTTLRTGYRYDNIWYSEDSEEDREEHLAFLDGIYAWTSRWNLEAGFSATWVRPEDDIREVEGIDVVFNDRETRYNVYGGPRFRYAEASEVYALVGNTWRRFSESENQSDIFWLVGLIHSFAPYVASLETGVRYPYDSSLGRTRQETFVTASLSRAYALGIMRLTGSYTGLDDPREKAYRGGFTVDRGLSPRLTADAGLFAERREEFRLALEPEYEQDVIREWSTLLSLRYLLGRDFTASLSYRYTDSSASDPLSDDNFQENRVTLELRKTF